MQIITSIHLEVSKQFNVNAVISKNGVDYFGTSYRIVRTVLVYIVFNENVRLFHAIGKYKNIYHNENIIKQEIFEGFFPRRYCSKLIDNCHSKYSPSLYM